MSDNAGWLKKMLMWDWHEICLDSFPGWEIGHSVPFSATGPRMGFRS
jgi:hypothetical protein